MRYHSTRSLQDTVSGREAVFRGLAPDGGLYVTDRLNSTRIDPAVYETGAGSYAATARAVLGALLDDFTEDEIRVSVENAYGSTFSSALVTPVTALGDMHLLELYHGPTAAFKDVALCLLPQLMSRALSGTGRRLMIATATSGDTGKAALEGFRDVPDIGITVLYPENGVSAVQERQMTTQRGKNVTVLAVRGNFDDAQRTVKSLFTDPITKTLAAYGISLTSANSINIGRLVPQMVYYFEAYRQLRAEGKIKPGDRLDFTVPTGNFGDVLAGWCAKQLGLPVGRLIVASNANNVLTDFLTTGVYDRRRPLIKTLSPSMDILVSSNLERTLYWMESQVTGDAESAAVHTRECMTALAEKGFYQVTEPLLTQLQTEFGCAFADDTETKASIRAAWENEHRLIDPHTAVARAAALKNRTSGRAMCVLSTASPYKFVNAVYEALYGDVPASASPFDTMDELARRTGVTPPASLTALRTLPVLWQETLDVKDVPERILKAAQTQLVD